MDKQAQIERDFTYHPPLPGQRERYEVLRDQAKGLALAIAGLTPASREQSLAITKLEEAVMWANAAFSRHETADEPALTTYSVLGPPDKTEVTPEGRIDVWLMDR